jgi:Ca2+-binding RTX toxin-like protein
VGYGRKGNDYVALSNGQDEAYGGPGDDLIEAVDGKSSPVPGPQDQVYAGSGNDTILSNDDVQDVVDCGEDPPSSSPDSDRVRADAIDILRNCENEF